MFQWASLIGMSKRYNQTIGLPRWEYQQAFEGYPTNVERVIQVPVEEKHYHHDWKQFDRHLKDSKGSMVDIIGWLQSEKYWEDSINEVREAMKFKHGFVMKVMKKYSKILNAGSKIIAISVRRGDFVDNPNYNQLSIKYYLGALMEHFPGYESKFNLMIFSDDQDYCRIHFRGLKNVFFADGTAIEQLCAMSLCDHHIISNSTFSWWGAYLGEKKGTKVITPTRIFAGEQAAKLNEKDYFPARWIKYDQAGKKIDLKDFTFTIPVHFDHPDRMSNLSLNVCMLLQHFNTNIHIQEQGGEHFADFAKWGRYETRKDLSVFHRTNMLNDMAHKANTPFVVNWDADVIIPPAQIIEAARMLRAGSKMVFPYDGRFARVPNENQATVGAFLDIGRLAGITFKGTRPGDAASVGGAVMWSKAAFMAGGMENENFISYGPEDVERVIRFGKLGITPDRVRGVLFHLDHHIGDNSSLRHSYGQKNVAEFERIKGLNRSRLEREIKSWPWVAKYSADYYETIFENAIKSRDGIFKALEKLDFWSFDYKRVIDVGCGIGEFGHKADEYFVEYYGVDYRIPRDKLLIPAERYAEFDLTSDVEFPFKGIRFDLAICTEVLEHIPEEHAKKAVKLLCSLADTIVFSAAIPGQGGHNHVNEQWQSYWVNLFFENDFTPLRGLREAIWNNPDIDVWYRQNLIVFKNNRSADGELIDTRDFTSDETIFDVVHPQMFINHTQRR
jgi:2-polyprenyl-3-methyl-5-hydroxy-6-metoxy-1,4-benzoquinol methylase